ncbi:MAG: hypothetical protein F6J98_29130 [Moorea sp. SIO4G2]|uniref:hypothetical protein n=1 Tax=Moorena bouillonii TaxID=207920 RepID=UPI00118151C3|nr:hypothetical protein [Moorena bouillonii]NEO64252.1 hypothetical protein [Moorena sp. SIO4G2]
MNNIAASLFHNTKNSSKFFPTAPDSRFPIPDSRFPIPDSRFPIPDSRFPFTWKMSMSGSLPPPKPLLCDCFRTQICSNRKGY